VKSLAFFNNKGGVGKTTLACNLVSFLNMEKGKRVLLIDADPQCNATQAILDDEVCEKIYRATDAETLYKYLKPLEIGEPSIDTAISPLIGSSNRFQTDIIPGHPKMSVVEDRLSDAWSDLRARDIRGYRITNWATQLLSVHRDQYDLIVFDVGPSLGALNRSVILACDFIATPFGCDIFSLLGIQNISSWIRDWKDQYDGAILEKENREPGLLDRFDISRKTNNKFRFAGYSVQQYVQRKFKTGPRPVKSYDRIMEEIPSTVQKAMSFLTPDNANQSELDLGHIPYLYSLVPMAQASKAPIHDLRNSDGVVGSQYSQVRAYALLMDSLCDKLIHNIGLTK
jgi:cellulose biosynthesis protein BcsQ